MSDEKGKFKLVLFPGKISPQSPDRSLNEAMAEWIDSEGNLNLTLEIKIPPTITPSCKLIFKKINEEFVFLGCTTSETTYTQMADFSYNPSNPDTHIAGPAISKQSVPQPYNLEGNPSAAVLDAKLAARQEDGGATGAVAFLRFKDACDPPNQPTPLILSQASEGAPDEALLNKVKDLFDSRPVWQRASLEEALALGSIPAWRLASALRLVSYLFLDGPWRKCYVRFGFDPRKDPSSRHLQMIDFRDPFFKSEEGARASVSEDRDIDIHFRRAPTNRSQLYQLCDIEDPAIQALLATSCKMAEADPHTGWLTEVEMDSIRNQMKIKSESMRRSSVFR